MNTGAGMSGVVSSGIMGQKISVLVVTGFLGAGKTTLLNRLLVSSENDPTRHGDGVYVDPARTVVLVNEVGEIGLDHHLLRHVDDRVAILPSGCICCAVKGELVTTLRDLFLAALQRRITPFTHLINETTGVADPSAIRYTLAFDRFLADRYRYAGCVTVVDSIHVTSQFETQPEVHSQLAMADGLVMTKTDECAPEMVTQVALWLEGLFPQARRVYALELNDLTDLFALGVAVSRKSLLFGGKARPLGALSTSVHGALDVATDQWDGAVTRASLVKALAAALEQSGPALLRFKGIFQLEHGERVALHAVHGTAYPPEVINTVVDGLSDNAVVAIARGASAKKFLTQLRAGLSRPAGSGS